MSHVSQGHGILVPMKDMLVPYSGSFQRGQTDYWQGLRSGHFCYINNIRKAWGGVAVAFDSFKSILASLKRP